MQLLSVMLTLVLVLAQFTWTMFTALAEKPSSLTALEALMSTVDMATQRMLE